MSIALQNLINSVRDRVQAVEALIVGDVTKVDAGLLGELEKLKADVSDFGTRLAALEAKVFKR